MTPKNSKAHMKASPIQNSSLSCKGNSFMILLNFQLITGGLLGPFHMESKKSEYEIGLK